MKKLLSILLSLVLLGTVFFGCEAAPDSENAAGNGSDSESGNDEVESDAEPLRICVDLADVLTPVGEEQTIVNSTVQTLEMQYKAGYGGPAKVEFEIVPHVYDETFRAGADRETALSRLRTEIMSGGGPDLYIVTSPDLYDYGQALFPFPEKMMAAGYFLPLDDYIEKAQFMEWDKLEPAVMEVGKFDGKQMILPMTFKLAVTTFTAEDDLTYDTEASMWQDMVETDDPVLAAAAQIVFYGCEWSTSELLPYTLDALADYNAEELLITEEELFQRVMDVKKIVENEQAAQAPTHETNYISEYNGSIGQTMIPLYNTGGGATAFVKSYCAINSNTTQPENAFYVADHFLSEGMQKESGFYMAWKSYNALATDTEYVEAKKAGAGGEELTRVLDQISCVRYWTPLDNELSSILGYAHYHKWDEEEVHKLVSEAYKNMTMMVAES